MGLRLHGFRGLGSLRGESSVPMYIFLRFGTFRLRGFGVFFWDFGVLGFIIKYGPNPKP